MKKVPFTLWIPKDTMKKLRHLAVEKEMSLKDLINEAVIGYLEKYFFLIFSQNLVDLK